MNATQASAFKGYNLLTAAKSVISKYAVFSGRATRSEYWYWVLGQTAVLLLLDMAFTIFMIILFACHHPQQMSSTETFTYGMAGAVPLLLWSLFTVIPSLAVTCRRLHDTNKGGIMLLLFGMIAATGVNNMIANKTNMGITRNLIIVSLTLTTGIGGAILKVGDFTFAGIGLAAMVGVILNLILPRQKEEKISEKEKI